MTDFQKRYIAARRAVIARDLADLNPAQQEAAMATEGPLLLLAGAGSGKTTVLIQRIYTLLAYGRGSDSDSVPETADEAALAFLEHPPQAPTPQERQQLRHLCAVDPPRPWEIIAITFTNKAADELKERLARRLGPSGGDVWASTFHAACARILRRDIERLGFSRNFTIYDSDDSQRLMRQLLKEQGLDPKSLSERSVLSFISASKDRYEGPGAFRERYAASGDWRMGHIARLYETYQQRMKSADALDFDDLIFFTVQLFQAHPDVLAHYQSRFRYVLVDEYQDTNHIQSLLTGLLAGGHRNLCVVGDDDQSIYRFRGASIENILGFEERYEGARVIRLEQNYRSTQHILDAANAVISNNVGRKGKKLWTANGDGAPVIVQTTYDEGAEAAFVAGDILSALRSGHPLRDNAILYRMNAQSNALEFAMKRNAIPYRVVGGQKFFEREEIKDMMAYLCVLNNPRDDLRLRRIVNVPARGIGQATLEKVAALAEEQGVSLYDVLSRSDLYPPLKGPAPKIAAFTALIEDLRHSDLALPELYDALLERSGYLRALQESKDPKDAGRIENIRELRSNIVAFLDTDPEEANVSGFLNEMALYTDLDSADLSDECVTMMTVHAAKGLEFPRVYVVGLEEGVFPSGSALAEDDGLEEERRLCYVAMTRAKEQLVLTCAQRRLLFGYTSVSRPSRFLSEIRPEDLRESQPLREYGGGWSRPKGYPGGDRPAPPRPPCPGICVPPRPRRP